jgi:hypothetical protein
MKIILKDGQPLAWSPALDPSKIAQYLDDGIWTADDLAAHGLAAAEPFAVPDGKVKVGAPRYVQDKDGAWREEYDVEDAPPPPVPVSVTPRQARLAIEAAGLTEQVEKAVEAAGPAAKITWDYALEIRRDDPLLAGLAQAIGLSDAQVDALFLQAAQL